MLVDIVPGACRRNCKVHQHFFETCRMAVEDLDDQWLGLASDAGVYPGLASN